MRIEMGAASHVGQVREVNEDAWLILTELAVVADGMGGHSCGDVASALAVDQFRSLAERTEVQAADIHHMMERANRAILDAAAQDPAKQGMGTTLTGIALVDYSGSAHWLVFNVGDSRVYRVIGDSCVQLTVDHSEVAELVAEGRITAAEARVHPHRNVITRSLGSDPPPAADVWIFPPDPDETFVLCSDGLSNELDGREIARVTTGARSPRDAAAQLVGAAVEAGGRDNVTAVVVQLVAGEDDVDDTEVSTAPRPSPGDR